MSGSLLTLLFLAQLAPSNTGELRICDEVTDEDAAVCRLHRSDQLRRVMGAKRSSTKQSTNDAKSDLAVSYNEFKEHEGQRYTGMKIGRSHKWYYDRGEWKEKKITPDLWQIGYAVTKRRAGRAPEGSGVPVGTEYHWYIVAHQNTAKQTANDYTTTLSGLKFKIAHKRAGSEKWSVTLRTQRKRMIMFFWTVIADLEKQNDREVAVTTVPKPQAARKHRKARMPRATLKRSAERQRRELAAQPYARRASRVRRGRRSGLILVG